MIRPLPPNSTIGLVGGGQLGRMSALAAARLGYRCHILTREVDSPAAQVSHAVTISDSFRFIAATLVQTAPRTTGPPSQQVAPTEP